MDTAGLDKFLAALSPAELATSTDLIWMIRRMVLEYPRAPVLRSLDKVFAALERESLRRRSTPGASESTHGKPA